MPYAYDIFWKTYFGMSTTCSRSSFAFHIFGNWNNPTNGFKITFAVNFTILIMRGRSFLGPKTSSMSILKKNTGIFSPKFSRALLYGSGGGHIFLKRFQHLSKPFKTRIKAIQMSSKNKNGRQPLWIGRTAVFMCLDLLCLCGNEYEHL